MEQLRCLSTDKWIKKIWYMYIYNGVLTDIKRNKIGSFIVMWMKLESVIHKQPLISPVHSLTLSREHGPLEGKVNGGLVDPEVSELPPPLWAPPGKHMVTEVWGTVEVCRTSHFLGGRAGREEGKVGGRVLFLGWTKLCGNELGNTKSYWVLRCGLVAPVGTSWDDSEWQWVILSWDGGSIGLYCTGLCNACGAFWGSVEIGLVT